VNRSNDSVPVPHRPRLQPYGRGRLLVVMLAVAAAIHAAILVAFTPAIFRTDYESPERLYELGEAELARGRYTEAMALFQKVLDLQPKLPPIFEKAAEQHKLAERLQRQSLARAAATTRETSAEAGQTASPGGAEQTPRSAAPDKRTASPATRPADMPFIPPELRPR